MHPIDRTLVPDVTDEEIEQAFEGEPASFVEADEQDQLDVDLPRAFVVVPASIPQRCANAKRLRDDQTFVGVGMCLATVRGPILGLPAVYPTAAIAGDNSKPFHPIKDADSVKVPRGAIGFAWNGGAGHVWLELGAALVSTTDFHRNGFEGVALRSRMLAWCGATRWGWGESVNGFDVWPDPKKPAPKPEPDRDFHLWRPARKVNFLRREADRQRKAGNDGNARHLEKWADQIEARAKGSK